MPRISRRRNISSVTTVDTPGSAANPCADTSRAPLVIVLVISSLEFGGAQRQVLELMRASSDSDIVFQLVSLSNYVPLAEQLPEHSSLHIVNKRFRLDITVIWRLARLLTSLRADVVHGFLFDAEIAARIAGFLARTPVIIGSERNTDYSISRIQRIAYRLTKSLRNFCIANSNAGAQFNSRALGYPTTHYFVVHNGVDTNRFRPADKMTARRRLGISEGEFCIGMFASFKARKNHMMFIKAAAVLAKLDPEINFLLVGDSLQNVRRGTADYSEWIKQQIRDLGLWPRFRLLGNVADIESVYPCCDMTVLTSRIEGTPNVLLESMSCGVPVVATDVADNSIVVPDKEAGIIVPLDDVDALVEAILTIRNDSHLHHNMSIFAREWVCHRFSNEMLARKMADAYSTAVRQA